MRSCSRCFVSGRTRETDRVDRYEDGHEYGLEQQRALDEENEKRQPKKIRETASTEDESNKQSNKNTASISDHHLFRPG